MKYTLIGIRKSEEIDGYWYECLSCGNPYIYHNKNNYNIKFTFCPGCGRFIDWVKSFKKAERRKK